MQNLSPKIAVQAMPTGDGKQLREQKRGGWEGGGEARQKVIGPINRPPPFGQPFFAVGKAVGGNVCVCPQSKQQPPPKQQQ
jgi:hypothetical protein